MAGYRVVAVALFFADVATAHYALGTLYHLHEPSPTPDAWLTAAYHGQWGGVPALPGVQARYANMSDGAGCVHPWRGVGMDQATAGTAAWQSGAWPSSHAPVPRAAPAIGAPVPDPMPTSASVEAPAPSAPVEVAAPALTEAEQEARRKARAKERAAAIAQANNEPASIAVVAPTPPDSLGAKRKKAAATLPANVAALVNKWKKTSG